MKVLFIQTGGTIDKDYPAITEGYLFEITEPAVKRILEKVKPLFDFKILSLLQKDSLDLTDEDRDAIRDACVKADEDKILITHGTDTIIETAERLAGIKNKLIVLTGAMRPERFSNSDADFNIGLAIGALNLSKEGVFITMSGRIYPLGKVKRDLNTGRFVEI